VSRANARKRTRNARVHSERAARFLARDKSDGPGSGGPCRDRRGRTLFIDARQMGAMVDCTHRELTDEDIGRIAGVYHAWRAEEGAGDYEDVPGFCRSATTEQIAQHSFVLKPSRYVGAAASEENDEPFDEKMKRLAAELAEQFAERRQLEGEIAANLGDMGMRS